MYVYLLPEYVEFTSSKLYLVIVNTYKIFIKNLLYHNAPTVS